MSFTAVAFPLTAAQLSQLPSELIGQATSAFSRNRSGKLGFGERYRFTTCGQQRFTTARDWWSKLTATTQAALPAGMAASAPVCFAAFTFDGRSSQESVFTVPKYVLDIAADSTTLRFIYDVDEPLPPSEDIFASFIDELPGESCSAAPTDNDVVVVSAYMSECAFRQAVDQAVEMIGRGAVDKIVLARDELLYSQVGFDIPATMRALAAQNPTAWTYKVGGLVGSTPELLIARQGDAATARVLAGTVDRDVAINEQLIAAQLSESPKQIFEHQAAVDSLVEKLAPFSTNLHVSEQPFVLALPNVYHLATDISADLTGSTTVLDLVAQINPTAAVGGTPREPALEAIWQLEAEAHGMDRGLYAGAVGWFDSNGYGEFGIALRGSVIEDEHHMRLYAGGGIVRGSVADEELAETQAKLRPMKKALKVRA